MKLDLFEVSHHLNSEFTFFLSSFFLPLFFLLLLLFSYHYHQGLYSVLSSNLKLAEPIIQLLLNHFDQYHEKETYTNNPIKLDSCVTCCGSGTVSTRREPLAHLVNCLQQCTAKLIEAEKHGSIPAVSRAAEVLESVAQRMMECELDDYELVSKEKSFPLLTPSLPPSLPPFFSPVIRIVPVSTPCLPVLARRI